MTCNECKYQTGVAKGNIGCDWLYQNRSNFPPLPPYLTIVDKTMIGLILLMLSAGFLISILSFGTQCCFPKFIPPATAQNCKCFVNEPR